MVCNDFEEILPQFKWHLPPHFNENIAFILLKKYLIVPHVCLVRMGPKGATEPMVATPNPESRLPKPLGDDVRWKVLTIVYSIVWYMYWQDMFPYDQGGACNNGEQLGEPTHSRFTNFFAWNCEKVGRLFLLKVT